MAAVGPLRGPGSEGSKGSQGSEGGGGGFAAVIKKRGRGSTVFHGGRKLFAQSFLFGLVPVRFISIGNH